MKTTKIKIIDSIGLHARPASIVSREAKKYSANIILINEENNKEANVKSILSLMSLCASHDTILELKVTGSDEEVAFNAILKSLKDNKLI